MAKEKLFTPEDFDKPTDKKWYQSKGFIITLFILAVAIIVGLVLYFSSNKSGEVSQSAQPNNAVVENVTSSTSRVEITDSSVTETVPEVASQVDASLSNSTIIENPPIPMSSDVEKEAFKVIRGEYGNNPIRKNKLGDDYQNIQNRVNELKRQGAF